MKGNHATADMQNRNMVIKLQKDPDALEGVRKEMEKLMALGLIERLKDLPKNIQEEINSDSNILSGQLWHLRKPLLARRCAFAG